MIKTFVANPKVTHGNTGNDKLVCLCYQPWQYLAHFLLISWCFLSCSM